MDTRTCANCGAPLPPDAQFCSICGTAVQGTRSEFPAAAEAPPDSAVLPPLSQPPEGGSVAWEGAGYPERAAPDRGPWRILVVVLVGLVLVAGGTVATIVLTRGGSSIRLPQSIGGHPRVTSPGLRRLAEGVAKQAAIGSEKPQVAFYGAESAPAFLVMAYDFSVPEPTAAFGSATSAFERTSGGSVDLSSLQSVHRDGALYQCAPYTIQNVQGFLCMWSDSDTFGVIGTFSQTESGLVVVSEVHDAVVQ